MRIAHMRVTPIAIGDPPLLNASGLHAPYALRTILELETSCGITGISEIPGGDSHTASLVKCEPLVDGRDPFQLNSLPREIEGILGAADTADRGHTSWDPRVHGHVVAALEIACMDIIGKATGRSLADLLGGRMRDRVPFAAYLFFKHRGAGGPRGFDTDPGAAGWSAARQEEALTPPQIVAQAEAMLAAFDFRSIKLKAGILDPDVEVASVLALHEHFGPGMPLRMDPNGAWKYDTALARGRQMVEALEYLEDPVLGQENMGRLARELPIPLATNMCTTSFADLVGSLEHRSEEIILCDPHFWGGPRACIELGRIAPHLPRKISMHSNSHLGISLATMVHVGAALPSFDYALDTHYPWQEDEVIAGGKLPFEEGSVPVPTGPGLGVELDHDQLDRLHRQYLDAGITERDDESEMKKVDPGWNFQAVRY